MARIVGLDTGGTLFVDHHDPEWVTRLATRRVADQEDSMSMDTTHGPVAVITGASSGIGAATAIGADVTDRDALVAAAQRVHGELGGADVLVNNAGVMLLGPFGPEQRADYRQMIEVNLLGAITTTEVFLDQLRANGGGDLINISSIAGRTARPTNGVYAATKWGINGWSESLRQELQPDVRVTVIEPGAVGTELTDHITHAATKEATEQFVKDLAIHPEDIADVIAFAVSRPRRMTLNEILVRPTAQAG
jgi:NADP-dependent 3-hydroxy acid dehydrogenase YdfG